MRAKKNQYILSPIEQTEIMVGGIVTPEKRAKKTYEKFMVVAHGIENSEPVIKIGSVVACSCDCSVDSVFFNFKGKKCLILPADQISAIFEDEYSEQNITDDVLPIFPSEQSIKAVGDRIAILRDPSPKDRIVGNLYLPTSNHEHTRAHSGVVIGIGKTASEKTGLKIGHAVMYDRWSTHVQEYEFDLVDSVNVIAILSQSDIEELKKGIR